MEIIPTGEDFHGIGSRARTDEGDEVPMKETGGRTAIEIAVEEAYALALEGRATDALRS